MAYRKEKVEKMVQKLVSETLIKEINDPRIGFISITNVELNKDFSIAKVGFSVIGKAKELRNATEGLKSARGYIQKSLGSKMSMRITPRIEFYPDASVSEGVKMVDLLENLDGVKENESEQND